ncbi:MAG TPA: hypothetical protein VFM96_00890 [Gaiellaceae bacterium]|nr:hypothetical protein [Gaiellaceae bacterium]
MPRRELRMAIVLFVALAMLAALPFIGRWERNRNARTQNARLAAVFRRATSDGLVSHRLWRYRLDWSFDCLTYTPQGDPSATGGLELCFAPDGRLIETIDRSSGTAHFGELPEQPSLASLRVPIHDLVRAFAAAGAFHDPRLQGLKPDSLSGLPIGFDDIGAFHYSKPKQRAAGP